MRRGDPVAGGGCATDAVSAWGVGLCALRSHVAGNHSRQNCSRNCRSTAIVGSHWPRMADPARRETHRRSEDRARRGVAWFPIASGAWLLWWVARAAQRPDVYLRGCAVSFLRALGIPISHAEAGEFRFEPDPRPRRIRRRSARRSQSPLQGDRSGRAALRPSPWP